MNAPADAPRVTFQLCDTVGYAMTGLEVQLTEDLRDLSLGVQRKACEAAKARLRDMEHKISGELQSRVVSERDKKILADHIRSLISQSADRLGVPARR